MSFSTDERGCLVINTPHLQQQRFITNDIVQLVDTTHFEWLGRHDNVINSGGVKLFPESIEARIASFLSQRFFITAEDDNRLGQKAVLVIESLPWTRPNVSNCYPDLNPVYLLTKFPRTYIFKNISRKPIPAKLYEK